MNEKIFAMKKKLGLINPTSINNSLERSFVEGGNVFKDA
jgi:hypothetical protein